MPIRLALVEDQALLLAALAALLDLEPDITVAGRFSDPREAAEAIPELAPSLVLTDIEMPDMSGFELARALWRKGVATRIVMLSTFSRAGYVDQALELGVHGYLLKESPPETLLKAIRNVMAGLVQFDSQLLEGGRRPGERLTDRERVILRHVRDGAANKDVAAMLALSPGTIRNSISEIIAKLGAKNRVEACRIAEREGWI